MADEQQQTGPVMLCVTRVMNPGGLRIARLWGNVTLPRTVPVKTLVAGGIGVCFGVLLSLAIAPGLNGSLYGAIFGGAGGIALASWSPLQNESLWRWLSLNYETKRRQITVDGRAVIIAVGICRLSAPARGQVRLVSGSVNVPPSQRDERGAVISSRNRNLDRLPSLEEAEKMGVLEPRILEAALATSAPPPSRWGSPAPRGPIQGVKQLFRSWGDGGEVPPAAEQVPPAPRSPRAWPGRTGEPAAPQPGPAPQPRAHTHPSPAARGHGIFGSLAKGRARKNPPAKPKRAWPGRD